MTHDLDMDIIVRMKECEMKTNPFQVYTQGDTLKSSVPGLHRISLIKVRTTEIHPASITASVSGILTSRHLDYSKFRTPNLTKVSSKIDNNGQDVLREYKHVNRNHIQPISKPRNPAQSEIKPTSRPEEKVEKPSINNGKFTSLLYYLTTIIRWSNRNKNEPNTTSTIESTSGTKEEYSVPVSELYYINTNLGPGDKEDPWEELFSPVEPETGHLHLECLEDSPSSENDSPDLILDKSRSEISSSGFGLRKGFKMFSSSISLPAYSNNSSLEEEELKIGNSTSLLHVPQTDEGTPMKKKSNLTPSNLTLNASNSTLKSSGSSPSKVSRVTINPAAYVDYPQDTRPSYRFPKRKTSRKDTTRIKIKRFQRTYCCCCFKGQVLDISDDILDIP